MSIRWSMVLVTMATAALAGACSGSDSEAGTDGAGAGGGGTLIVPGSGSTGSTGTDGCSYNASGRTCAGQTYAGENVPTDIYIMFDQSCSMSCPAEQTGAGLCCVGGPNPRMAQVQTAVGQFLRDPASSGIGVGIGYFGQMALGATSCDPAAYAVPAVGIAPLPGNADAIIASVNGAQPTGETPTGPAIRGACGYAAQHRAQNPGHKVVVLLVTDGVPEAPLTSVFGQCVPSVPDAVQAAGACATDGLEVYVLGVGARLDNLNGIAVAGGTDQAYLVQGADVSGGILAALNAIRAQAAIPCQLRIPPGPNGTTLNLATVNLAYCNGAGTSQTFYYVENAGLCDPQVGGWHYDDPQNPQRILLCGTSCGTVSQPGSKLVLSIGCETEIIPR